MGTDYSPQVPSRSELFARVLIACRDHSLAVPSSLSFSSPTQATMFIDHPYEFQEWSSFLGIVTDRTSLLRHDFYGWSLFVVTYTGDRMPAESRAAVDEAASGYESPAETFDLTVAAECRVPYVQPLSTDGMLTEIVSECARPKGHLGDHADMNRHQWANTYPAPYAPAHRAATP